MNQRFMFGASLARVFGVNARVNLATNDRESLLKRFVQFGDTMLLLPGIEIWSRHFESVTWKQAEQKCIHVQR